MWRVFQSCLKFPLNRPSPPASPAQLQGQVRERARPNFQVQVTIEGERLDDTGMLVDFIDVKNVDAGVIDRLDHQFLNEMPPFD